MEYLSGSTPYLIDNDIISNLEDNLSKNFILKTESIKYELINLGNFYGKYVKPNIFYIVLFCIFIVYLLMSFVTKKNSSEEHSSISGKDKLKFNKYELKKRKSREKIMDNSGSLYVDLNEDLINDEYTIDPIADFSKDKYVDPIANFSKDKYVDPIANFSEDKLVMYEKPVYKGKNKIIHNVSLPQSSNIEKEDNYIKKITDQINKDSFHKRKKFDNISHIIGRN